MTFVDGNWILMHTPRRNFTLRPFLVQWTLTFEPLIIVYFSTRFSLSHMFSVALDFCVAVCWCTALHAIQTTSTFNPWQSLLCSTHSFFYPFFFLSLRYESHNLTQSKHIGDYFSFVNILHIRSVCKHVIHGSMEAHLQFEETFGTRFQFAIISILLTICHSLLYGRNACIDNEIGQHNKCRNKSSSCLWVNFAFKN